MTFAQALSQAMGSMSQAELADKTGLRQATISRYLSSERQPSYEARILLERALPHLRDLLTTAVAS